MNVCHGFSDRQRLTDYACLPWLYNACLTSHLCWVHKWLSCRVTEPDRDKTKQTCEEQPHGTGNQHQIQEVKTNGTSVRQTDKRNDQEIL